MISVVIPALNAAATLPACLAALHRARGSGLVEEVIVVDGASSDDTAAHATIAAARVLSAGGGRGAQLSAGMAAASEPWLLALHADTRLQPGWEAAARAHAERRPDRAGWFRFRLDDPAPVARLWEAGVNLRSRLGLPYGDQALLISRRLYQAVGDYAPIPLMEDLNLVRRLGRERLAEIPADALTDARRYRREGYLGRSWRNWRLVRRYLAGEDPARLARDYD